MATSTKDSVLVASLVLSVVSLVLLFGVTWYFQSSLSLLQQQVEYDRDLLVKLQEQVESILNGNDVNKVKRQSDEKCQCKDGIPGPVGPPGKKGKKGDQGIPGVDGVDGTKGDKGGSGPIGDPGIRGRRGPIGDPGYPGPIGPPGAIGIQGEKGDRGETGDVGMKGQKGLPGNSGTKGSKGETGSQGIQGPTGPHGRGEPGPRGFKGEIGIKGDKGEKGKSGLPGSTGSPGSVGQKGIKGDKEERTGGTVYTRWGHNQCPSTAELVYSGRVGGTSYEDSGGGSNPQCLPLNPSYLTTIPGSHNDIATMYGAEYKTDYFKSAANHNDIPCAVCYVGQRSTVFMLPAKYRCPFGWTTEYYGYLMAERWTHYRSQFTCVDSALRAAVGSGSNHNGMVFYPVEGRCGSLPCPPYDQSKELTCAVCTR